ncbi:MAG TPA: DNA translocase FtsK 4TM domain-containing protein, partial [Croceibacterium sp.]|nr:DNA translocase FtsK 4TM domain-containing protein [Croceibacterium sp.]
MASRAIARLDRGAQPADWRAAFRRSLARAMQLIGAGVLGVGTVFLALALISYTQTDPSASTAAGGKVANWMGRPGAWVAERALFFFGLVSVLLLPALYATARKLWRDADEEETPHGRRWWGTLGMLLLAMALLGTALTLAAKDVGSLPASLGGIVGLLGAGGIRALASRVPEAAQFWTMAGAWLLCVIAGCVLAGRVFAFDWARLMTLPDWLRRKSSGPEIDSAAPRASRARRDERVAPVDDDVDDAPARKPPEIADTRQPPRPAKLSGKPQQKDLFDSYTLPGLELLADPPPDKGQKLDKLALERNARLLENVLDDFNVKGEITAVRTGPVVTMYELEPAPGIKASRVIGLAEDIARNMSAISARVSPIPGKTVMGIELPNADRQMVSFKELAACEAFADSKGNLPIILGKDIAGEPVVADLAAMPHLLVAGTTGSGKSVGLNTILLSLLYRFTPAQCRLILIDPKILELKTYDDIPHLLSPVVTEPAKSVRALKWAVEEMERRYRMMSDIGVRNLNGFNDKVKAAIAKGKPLGRRVQTGFDPETGE